MTRPTPVVATVRPATLTTAVLRDWLLHDPHVAYALVRADPRRPPIAATGRALLAWTGRVGTTCGRKAGEQHFVRLVPYLRSDAITDVVLLGADALGIDGLSLLFDAAHAAGATVWALLDPAPPAERVEWVAAYVPGGLSGWDDVESYWARRTDVPDLAEACPTVAHAEWLTADPPSWPDATGCPVHQHPLACAREALRRGVARSLLTVLDARARVSRLLTVADTDVRDLADDLLGVDVYRPAARTLARLSAAVGAPLDPAVGDVSADGSTVTAAGRTISVPAGMAQRALARQRAHTILAGGAPAGPVLTIFGEGGFAA